MWKRQNDGPPEVNTGSGSSLHLNFNPLKASDGDTYTCIAIVDIPDVPDGISVGGVKSTDIVVTCKCMHIYIHVCNSRLLTTTVSGCFSHEDLRQMIET